MKKILAIILAVVLVICGTSIAVSAYSASDSAQTVKEAIAEYEADIGEPVATYRYYFLEPNGSTGLKGKDEKGTFYNQFVPDWNKGQYTEAGPGIYWWASGCFDPSGWIGYKVDGHIDGTNVYYADVPQFVTTVIWNNGIDGGMDPLQPVYDKAMQGLNQGAEYYDPEDCPEYYPEGLYGPGEYGEGAFDNMIWVANPDVVQINDFSGKMGFGGYWFYYYGDDCFGCVKDGENDLEHNCLNEAHTHGSQPTEPPTPPTPTKLYGDVDANEKVDIYDVTTLQKYLAGFDGITINEENAAVQDKGVDIFCATCIQKFLVSLSNIDGSVPYDATNPKNPTTK